MSNNSPVLEDFGKAIERLKEVLDLEKTAVVRDSAVKRFELCFDLAWKSIKEQAKIQGVECYSPRACFKAAFQLKLIDYEQKWLKMIDDRNLAAHLYKEEKADQLFPKLPGYLKLFEDLFLKLKSINL